MIFNFFIVVFLSNGAGATQSAEQLHEQYMKEVVRRDQKQYLNGFGVQYQHQNVRSAAHNAAAHRDTRITPDNILSVNNEADLRAVLEIMRRRLDNIEQANRRSRFLEAVLGNVKSLLTAVEAFSGTIQKLRDTELDIVRVKKETPKIENRNSDKKVYLRTLLNVSDERVFLKYVQKIQQNLETVEQHESYIAVLDEMLKRLNSLKKRAAKETETLAEDIHRLSRRIKSDRQEKINVAADRDQQANSKDKNEERSFFSGLFD